MLSVHCAAVSHHSLPTSREEARGGIYYFPANGTLVIGGAGSSNNGAYTCTGKNVFGVRSASTQFTFTSTGMSSRVYRDTTCAMLLVCVCWVPGSVETWAHDCEVVSSSLRRPAPSSPSCNAQKGTWNISGVGGWSVLL